MLITELLQGSILSAWLKRLNRFSRSELDWSLIAYRGHGWSSGKTTCE